MLKYLVGLKGKERENDIGVIKMETRDKVRILLIIYSVVLTAVLVFSNLQVETIEPKERKEIYKTTCEHWEVCDYFEDFLCPSIDCPLKYKCVQVDKNCEPTLQVNQSL